MDVFIFCSISVIKVGILELKFPTFSGPSQVRKWLPSVSKSVLDLNESGYPQLILIDHPHCVFLCLYINQLQARTSPRQPPRFCTYFLPGSRGFVPSELPKGCLGFGPIIKVPSCQLMPQESTFQLQTDLPSIAAL